MEMHAGHPEAPPMCCIECELEWADPAERWRLKITDDDPVETALYCAACATREFGPASRPARALRRPA